MELALGSSERPLRIISVYWPAATAGVASEGLQARAQRWLEDRGKEPKVDVYVKAVLESRITRKGGDVCIVGDFNRGWGSELTIWSQELHLRNYHASWKINSRFSGDRPTGTIDYMLGNVDQLAGHCESAEDWRHFSDHRPLWVTLKIPNPTSEIREQEKRFRPTSRTAGARAIPELCNA